MISAAAPRSKDAMKGKNWKKTEIKEETDSTTKGIKGARRKEESLDSG